MLPSIRLTEISKDAIRTYLIEKELISIKEFVQAYSSIATNEFHEIYRLSTNKSSLLLKQPKKWSASNAFLNPLPEETLKQEAGFYELIRAYDYLSRFMPAFYLFDEENQLLILEDISDAENYYPIYKKHHINNEELQQIVKWLNHLHRVRLQPKEKALLENENLKTYYVSSFFDFPDKIKYAPDHALAAEMKLITDNSQIHEAIQSLKNSYQQGGFTLLHGDYQPGNWLSSDGGVYIIDPKFSTFGRPEIDLGSLVGHLLLASLPATKIEMVFDIYEDKTIDKELTFRFAGLEMIRRLIGVYPILFPATVKQKRSKLNDAIQLLKGRQVI
jgi:5-methylthioribose kinase